MKPLPLIFILSAAALGQAPVLLDNGWPIRPAGTQVPVGAFPMSTALSPDGRFLLVLNGGYQSASISVIDVAAEKEVGRTPAPEAWLGVAFTPKGDLVYAGGGSRASILEFKFANGALLPGRTFPIVAEAKRLAQDFIGDVVLSPDGRLIYAADLFRNSVAVINPQSGMVIERFKTGRRPYRILFHPDGKSFFVTSWTDGTLGHYQADNGALLATVRLAPHPTDMVWRPGPVETAENVAAPIVARLFVAAANTNNVYSIGVTAGKDLRVLESINVAMTPRHPLGMTPSALALSPDAKQLYVACSDANAVAIADVSMDRADVRGFIPSGAYPTAVRAFANGKMAIVNGRSGTVSFLAAPGEALLDDYSRTVLANSPYSDSMLDSAGIPPGGPIPSRSAERSPIEHVIYIVNAAPGERSGPNRDKLAREFVRLDGSFSPAGGLGWPTAAIASDYAQKMWPRAVPYDGREPTDRPGAGYLWTNAAARQIPMRNYGHFVANTPAAAAGDGAQVTTVLDPVLAPVTNLSFRGPDPLYPDAERIKAFLKDLADFEKSGQMPRLILMRLESPDSDAALGSLVEAASRSRFWPSTAIFALDGSAFVISPYAKRGMREANPAYGAAALLRTIELILGLNPMTHFDAGAFPLHSAFQGTPNPVGYTAAPAK